MRCREPELHRLQCDQENEPDIRLVWPARTNRKSTRSGRLRDGVVLTGCPAENHGMAKRPLVVAFDVIETLFPLEPMRRRLIDAGQPGHVLDLWFCRLLRDAFALVASDSYRPFGEIATSALRSTARPALGDEAIQRILVGFAELDPHSDVEPAMRLLREAGVRMVTLTNGSTQNTAALLRRAGIDDDIEQVLSVDDVRRWKPA